MSKKKRKNLVPISLDLSQRRALWTSLGLLSCLSLSEHPNVDMNAVSDFVEVLASLDGRESICTFNMTAAGHRICSIAVRYACRFLDGEYGCFIMPIIDQIEIDLLSFSDSVRALDSIFQGRG